MATRITAALVVAHVNGRVQHLYRGDIVPAGIDAASLANLKALGFVDSDETSDATPDGEPSDAWKVDDLKTYAGEHDVDLGDATKKADILAAIVAAKA
jgi:hypothetical protein